MTFLESAIPAILLDLQPQSGFLVIARAIRNVKLRHTNRDILDGDRYRFV